VSSLLQDQFQHVAAPGAERHFWTPISLRALRDVCKTSRRNPEINASASAQDRQRRQTRTAHQSLRATVLADRRPGNCAWRIGARDLLICTARRMPADQAPAGALPRND